MNKLDLSHEFIVDQIGMISAYLVQVVKFYTTFPSCTPRGLAAARAQRRWPGGWVLFLFFLPPSLLQN